VLQSCRQRTAEKQARRIQRGRACLRDNCNRYLAARTGRATLVKGSELDETAKVYRRKCLMNSSARRRFHAKSHGFQIHAVAMERL